MMMEGFKLEDLIDRIATSTLLPDTPEEGTQENNQPLILRSYEPQDPSPQQDGIVYKDETYVVCSDIVPPLALPCSREIRGECQNEIASSASLPTVLPQPKARGTLFTEEEDEAMLDAHEMFSGKGNKAKERFPLLAHRDNKQLSDRCRGLRKKVDKSKASGQLEKFGVKRRAPVMLYKAADKTRKLFGLACVKDDSIFPSIGKGKDNPSASNTALGSLSHDDLLTVIYYNEFNILPVKTHLQIPKEQVVTLQHLEEFLKTKLKLGNGSVLRFLEEDTEQSHYSKLVTTLAHLASLSVIRAELVSDDELLLTSHDKTSRVAIIGLAHPTIASTMLHAVTLSIFKEDTTLVIIHKLKKKCDISTQTELLRLQISHGDVFSSLGDLEKVFDRLVGEGVQLRLVHSPTFFK